MDQNQKEKPVLDSLTTERLFCLAILQEGTDVADRILTRFIDYRERKDEVLKELEIQSNNP